MERFTAGKGSGRYPRSMSRGVPVEIEELARSRAEARLDRKWAEADRLREQIEAAGWKVVDRGVKFDLSPAHPPDVLEAGRVRYGTSASVPSRLGEPPTFETSVILLATDFPDDLARAVDGLRAHAPEETQLVITADDPSPAQVEALTRIEELTEGAADDGAASGSPARVEIVWTSQRIGYAASLNAAIRRASGRVIVLIDTSVEPTGDVVSPLVRALDDPGIAVAGAFGVKSADLRHFEAAPPGDVDAIEGYCIAFRRNDYMARGPLDEHFRYYRNLDLLWSMTLRDEGEGELPRRALAIDLPLVRHAHRGWNELGEAERNRLSKRNFYRIIDRFGRRLDLVSAGRKVS
jgi:cysteinyl-tRNA synthetase